jgi:hypothetical protein
MAENCCLQEAQIGPWYARLKQTAIMPWELLLNGAPLMLRAARQRRRREKQGKPKGKHTAHRSRNPCLQRHATVLERVCLGDRCRMSLSVKTSTQILCNLIA